MSKREYHEKVMVCTYESPRSKEQMLKDMVALRKMLKRLGIDGDWAYVMHACSSNTDLKKGKIVEARPHIHIYLQANPCSTVVEAIRNYWKNKRKLGIVKISDGYNMGYYTNTYMKDQAIDYITSSHNSAENQ